MGLCKCEKRKVTNLFCFEHDVNVCEYCLVTEHERCIVQSYVQWLQDSDYNPICILCKNLLKDEPTVRLVCYDVFHWSCLDKYASELPANTAPAGYQCPKCKECIFPPSNLVSPVVDVLKQKLETVNWSRVGLGQSLLQIDDVAVVSDTEQIVNKETTDNLTASNLASNTTDDESNGFVIVKQKEQQSDTSNKLVVHQDETPYTSLIPSQEPQVPINQPSSEPLITKSNQALKKNDSRSTKIDMTKKFDTSSVMSNYNDLSKSHNRAQSYQQSNLEATYDSSLGVVLNIDTLDRDTGENKYKRRPLFEWLFRLLKSRQLSSKFRMTRQKKILFFILLIFIGLFTLIIIFSRLGSMSTEDDPALDPLNNPHIRVE